MAASSVEGSKGGVELSRVKKKRGELGKKADFSVGLCGGAQRVPGDWPEHYFSNKTTALFRLLNTG